jgi:hypothetical protein
MLLQSLHGHKKDQLVLLLQKPLRVPWHVQYIGLLFSDFMNPIENYGYPFFHGAGSTLMFLCS